MAINNGEYAMSQDEIEKLFSEEDHERHRLENSRVARVWSRVEKFLQKVLVVGLALTFILGLVFLVILYYPWPRVHVTGDPVIVGSSTVEQGTQVQWQRQKVCVPAGMTTVKRWAIFLDSPDPPFEETGIDIGDFYVNVREGFEYCGEPEFTLVNLPSDLPPGRYIIRVDSYTQNPSPRDQKVTSFSPEFTIVPKK